MKTKFLIPLIKDNNLNYLNELKVIGITDEYEYEIDENEDTFPFYQMYILSCKTKSPYVN